MVLSSFYKRGNSESKRMMNNKLHRVSGAQTQLCPVLKPQGISVVHVWACLYQGIHFLSVWSLTWNPRYPQIPSCEVPGDLSRMGTDHLFDPRWPRSFQKTFMTGRTTFHPPRWAWKRKLKLKILHISEENLWISLTFKNSSSSAF